MRRYRKDLAEKKAAEAAAAVEAAAEAEAEAAAAIAAEEVARVLAEEEAAAKVGRSRLTLNPKLSTLNPKPYRAHIESPRS